MHYINDYANFMLQIGTWGEGYGMKPHEICDVLSNRKAYYKEVFDVYGFMCLKMRGYYKLQEKLKGKNKRKNKQQQQNSNEDILEGTQTRNYKTSF